MSNIQILDRYAASARIAGVQVEFIRLQGLPERLGALLEEEVGQLRIPVVNSVPDHDIAPRHDGSSTSESGDGISISNPGHFARIAALPLKGWPEELLETVRASLAASGFRIVSPNPADNVIPESIDSGHETGGFTWDRDRLAQASFGITFCPVFLADTGSMVAPAGQGFGTLAALLPEIHIALSHEDGCRASLAEHLSECKGRLPSRLTLITGPSRTGDIEATMTAGVHGPRRVFHIILTKAAESD